MVKVLVGKRQGPSFPGFWAEFEGEEVGSYEDTRGEQSIAYTLYRCPAENGGAYRVHVADEGNPANPVYELHPNDPDPDVRGPGADYSSLWTKEQVVAKYPLFVKNLADYLPVRRVGPPPRGF